MVNINGYGKQQVGGPGPKSHVPGGKKTDKADKPEKSKHTDVVDFSSTLKNKEAEKADAGLKVGATNEKTQGLSQKAKDYLEKLKKKYGNMDFIVSDFSSDEEADRLLSKGKGEYNVLLTPDLLERMADDEETAAKYEGIIESSVNDIKQAKEDLGEDADMVEKFGVSVDGDGNVTYHAKIIDALTNNKDGGKMTIKAATIGDLLDQIKALKEENAEKLAKIRAEAAEQAKKEAEKLEEANDPVSDLTNKQVEDKSAEMAQYTPFNAEA